MASIFDPVSGYDAFATVSFVRGFRSQNSAGEIETIFRPVGAFTGELQPVPASLLREVHGQVIRAHYEFIVAGMTTLQAGDRCTIRGAQCEIIDIDEYGTDHSHMHLRYVGR